MRRKIFFPSSQGIKICGVISNPNSSLDTIITISCHGFLSSKESRTNKALEKKLNETGFSILMFDFFGHGESEGDFAGLTISASVENVLSAIEFLEQSGYTRIGLLGSSFGGMASLLAASKTTDLVFLALKSPVVHYPSMIKSLYGEPMLEEWQKKGFADVEGPDGRKHRLKYNFFEDSLANDGYKACERISIPTLIVHGDKDETVAVDQSQKAAGLIRNCRLETIEGADHRYTKPDDFDRMLDLISEFIRQHS